MKQYIVDAFTDKVFSGNPAAVCVPDTWLPDALMQAMAMENNLSETAFAVRKGDAWGLRWFTPGGEIDLCGHATLATAYTLLRFFEPGAGTVAFDTVKSGRLTVTKRDGMLEMDLPSYPLQKLEVTPGMEDALGRKVLEAWLGRDMVCVLEDEEAVRTASPDMKQVERLAGAGVHITAPGQGFDMVSRSFFPELGVPEDPVCGSGHCHLAPLWAGKLHKTELLACQASRRGGVLRCEVKGERVSLAGYAALYAVTELFPDGLPDGIR